MWQNVEIDLIALVAYTWRDPRDRVASSQAEHSLF